MTLDVAKIKSDFPIFGKSMRNGKKLIYLDSGATSQKPKSVAPWLPQVFTPMGAQ